MFKLDEQYLRGALANPGNDDIKPLDRWPAGADDLDELIDYLLQDEIVEREARRATIGVYPLSECDPTPLIAVGPGGPLCLLGGEVRFGEERRSDPFEATIEVVRNVVQDANALHASLVALIEAGQASLSDIAPLAGAQRPNPETSAACRDADQARFDRTNPRQAQKVHAFRLPTRSQQPEITRGDQR